MFAPGLCWMSMFFILLSCASMSCVKILINETRFYLAQVPSGPGMCAFDQASETVCARSYLECSEFCQNTFKCSNFNYLASSDTCQLFTFTPKCYGLIASCRRYQRISNQPILGIPAENCSLPYTYKTKLYMGCALNITGVPCNFGCLTSNRVPVTCQRETADFTAIYITQNVSIPNGTPMLLQSVNKWIVIQQRLDDSFDFALPWMRYKVGFGDINSNVWLGLESMYQLTNNAQYRLRVEVQSIEQGKWASAEYGSFRIRSESNGYAINLSGYIGDAGDGLHDPKAVLNGMKFTTIDVDNDMSPSYNCAVNWGGGGWWYNYCHLANLNMPVGSIQFMWVSLIDQGIASTSQLQKSRMMIKMV